MSRRRKDKFMQDMGRIHRAHNRRRAQRENERLLDEDKSGWQDRWEDVTDSYKFRTQEFGALGREVTRGVSREAGNLGKEVLKEGLDLAIDLLSGLATLGLTAQPSPLNGRNGRHHRRH